MSYNFKQNKTCKNRVFIQGYNGSECRFGVKVKSEILKASKPLEPCYKVISDRAESKFYQMNMDKIFMADLALFRA